jgi:chemosensory pili system protein ChpA (sensor histidine kinase/response regulator)
MNFAQETDFTTLSWIKAELDATLSQARQALERFAANSADSQTLRNCADGLHVAHGTLKMVEMYGAALVVDEMERVARGMLDGGIAPREDVYSVLMRGFLQLPDYLERVQSGHKDIPIVLLPLLNDLRAARGEKLLSEAVLFSPNIDAPLPVDAGQPLPAESLRKAAAGWRNEYQTALLNWIRDANPDAALARMQQIFDQLYASCAEVNARRLWWIAGAAADDLRRGTIISSVAIRLLFGKIDREIKRLVDEGEGVFASAPPKELVKNLLYYLAHADGHGQRGTEVVNFYRLQQLMPSEDELAHAQGSISGHNRALFDTVAGAIREDLLRVKDTLNIYLHSPRRNVADLAAQGETLASVADTFGMLGLGQPREIVLEQRAALSRIVNGEVAADENSLLDIAGALLVVEASLEDHIDRLGAKPQVVEETQAHSVPRVEVVRLFYVLMQEALVNVGKIKQGVLAYIESSFDRTPLEPVPGLLTEVAGALDMLALRDLAKPVGMLIAFVRDELLDMRRIPEERQTAALADAIAALEYYIEAVRDQHGDRERSLALLTESVASFESAQVQPAEVAAAAADAESASTMVSAPAAVPVAAFEAAAAPVVAPTPAIPVIDDELRQVFLDEMDDEIASLRKHFPAWRADPAEQIEPLRTVRRSFHTLKGSGRLVGAVALGDFAWTVENMLNHVLDHSVVPSPALLQVVGEAVDALPRFREELRKGEPSSFAQAPFAAKVEQILAADAVQPAVAPVDEHAVAAPAAADAVAEPTHEAAPIAAFTQEPESEARAAAEHIVDEPIVEAHLADTPAAEVHVASEEPDGAAPLVSEAASQHDEFLSIRQTEEIGAADAESHGHEAEAVEHSLFVEETPLARETDHPGVDGQAAHFASAGEHASESEQIAAAGHTAEVHEAAIHDAAIQDAEIHAAETPAAVEPVSPFESVQTDLSQVGVDEPQAHHDIEMAALLAAEHEVESAHALEAPHETETPAHFAEHAATVAEDTAASHGEPVALIEHAPDFHLDPLLLEVLRSEAHAHLAVVDATVQRGHEPQQKVSEDLLRAAHTLNGAFAMADVPKISQVLMPLEAWLARLRNAGRSLDANGIGVLGEVSARTKATLAAFETPGTPVADDSALASRIVALRDGIYASEAIVDASAEPPVSEESISEESVSAEAATESAAAEELPAHPQFAADADVTVHGFSSETVQSIALETHDETHESSAQVAEEAAAAAYTALVAQAAGHVEPQATSVEESASLVSEESHGEAHPEGSGAIAAESVEPAHGIADFSHEANEPAHSVDESVHETVEPVHHESEPVHEQTHHVDELAHDETGEIVADAAALAHAEPPQTQEAATPDVPVAGDVDQDLIDVFVLEAQEILDRTDALLLSLRGAPDDTKLLDELRRDLHTVKGGANMSGLAPIGELGHAMESLLEGAVEHGQALDGASLHAVEQGFDTLHTLVQAVAVRKPLTMPTALIERIEALSHGAAAVEAQPSAGEAVPEAFTAVPGDVSGATAGVADEPSAAQSVADEAPQAQETEPVFAGSEYIRVRASQLDAMVNGASEVAIYRSRLEQQMSGYRSNAVEMEATVTRLREQLRRLELEAEAQMASRFQREGDTAKFDPLELDRFGQLQQLSRSLAESMSDLVAIQVGFDQLTRQSESLLTQQSRVSADLQEGLMRSRMVPFDSLVPALRRTLRQTATTLGKEAQLRVEGAQGEMDRTLLERMKAPLEHMLRNALAHGIEDVPDRLAAGKPIEGNVRIALAREATETVLRISDDGRGLDRAAIRRRAIERGLLAPDARIGDRELDAFILTSGFSTAENLSQIAGRGVGMDVVANQIKQLGGSLSIESNPGRGAAFTVRLPFTLGVTQAIIVRLGDTNYAIPMNAVQGAVHVGPADLEARLASEDPEYVYSGDAYSILDLAPMLGETAKGVVDGAQVPLLMIRSGDERAALRVDSVLGSREIVVKSVGPQITSVPGILGATIMGDGSVVMILDLAPLLRRTATLRVQGATPQQPVAVPQQARGRKFIMVVDDSITMRKAASRVLEREEMDVVTAKDGIDAIEKLIERIPDLVLLDIEMPRMDGYQFAEHMKSNPRTAHVPIIMITSRTGEKHRERAREIGVEGYLGKPYQEAELMRNIRSLLDAVKPDNGTT